MFAVSFMETLELYRLAKRFEQLYRVKTRLPIEAVGNVVTISMYYDQLFVMGMQNRKQYKYALVMGMLVANRQYGESVLRINLW
jgi:hypothetical protein